MHLKPITVRHQVILCGVVTFLLQAIRVCFIAARSVPGDLVVLVPDDAFYYMVLARNFARLHRWTFDGTAPATGFHVLWGYLLALLYQVAPGVSFTGVYVVTGLLGALLLGITAACLAALIKETFGGIYVPLVFLMLLTPESLAVNSMIMEAPLALACSSAIVLVTLTRRLAPNRRGLLLCAFLGLLGTLSRSDTGLWPACLCLAALLVHDGDRPARIARIQKSASAVLGATIGVVLVALHTHLVSGSWFQSSARIKLFWSAEIGHQLRPALLTSATPLFLAARLIIATYLLRRMLIFMVLVLVAAWVCRSQSRMRSTVGFAAVLAVAGYVLLYRFDSDAVQLWYIANFIVPMLIALCMCISLLQPYRWSKAVTLLMLIVAPGSGVAGFYGSFTPPYPTQIALYRAGNDLARQPLPTAAGSWNSGIMQYYSGGQLVNLDGLVNDDILPYMPKQTLDAYLRRRHLAFLVDQQYRLYDHQMKHRGGYDNQAMKQCVSFLRTLEVSPQVEKFNVALFQVDLDCTKRLTTAR